MILVSQIFLILSIIDRVVQGKITQQKVYHQRFFLVQYKVILTVGYNTDFKLLLCTR